MNDKWRIKAVIGLSITIIVLLLLVVILFLTVLSGSSEDSTPFVAAEVSSVTPSPSNVVTAEEVMPFFEDTVIDSRVYSE